MAIFMRASLKTATIAGMAGSYMERTIKSTIFAVGGKRAGSTEMAFSSLRMEIFSRGVG